MALTMRARILARPMSARDVGLLRHRGGKQHCRNLGVVGIGHKQQFQTIAVQSSVDALDLVWPIQLAHRTQMTVAVDDPDRGADAGSIMKGIIGILGDSTENHIAVGQRRRVGEAERNSFDQTEVDAG